MKSRVLVSSLGLVGLLVVVALVHGGGFAHAQDVGAEDPKVTCARSFAEALSSCDAQRIERLCGQQLWNRMKSSVPAEGQGCRYESLGAVELSKPRYAMAYLLCQSPDGVEDVVTITMKMDGNAWRVVGGPSGRTSATPLH